MIELGGFPTSECMKADFEKSWIGKFNSESFSGFFGRWFSGNLSVHLQTPLDYFWAVSIAYL